MLRATWLAPNPIAAISVANARAPSSQDHFFRPKVPKRYIAIHPDNIPKKDWIGLLETGTIVGPSTEKLRVAKTTVERTFVGKYDHALYFCPQLYKLDSDQKLVPLTGEEIGYILVQQLQHGVVEKRPWYEPSDKLPGQPVVAESSATDFGTLVIDAQRLQPVAIAKKNAPAKGLAT